MWRAANATGRHPLCVKAGMEIRRAKDRGDPEDYMHMARLIEDTLRLDLVMQDMNKAIMAARAGDTKSTIAWIEQAQYRLAGEK